MSLALIVVQPVAAQFSTSDKIEELVKIASEGISSLSVGRPRVAVLAFGDENGGRPQELNPKISQIEVKFLQLLSAAQVRSEKKPFILGPEAIANELRALGREGEDLSGLTPTNPEAVSRWLRDDLKGAFDIIVLCRVGENQSKLTLVSRDEKKPPIIQPAKVGWGAFSGRTDDAEIASIQPVVRPELFAAESGKPPRSIPLMRERGDFDGITYAIIPKDLEDLMGQGKLFLEIRLTHTGTVPSRRPYTRPDGREVNASPYCVLSDDPLRLFPVAVEVNGRGTIAESVEDHVNRGAFRSVFVAREPRLQRKWVLSRPDYAVVDVNAKGEPVVRRQSGSGNSVVSIKGFQNVNDTADTFVLRRPDEGASTKIGVNAVTGLLRITVFVGISRLDKSLPIEGAPLGPPGGKVNIEQGTNFPHRVRVLKVPIYNEAAEEHLIQLCTELQRDPKSENLIPFPAAVTE